MADLHVRCVPRAQSGSGLSRLTREERWESASPRGSHTVYVVYAPEAELLFAYLVVVAAKAHRRPEERLRAAFPRMPLKLCEWLWAEVDENWRDVVNLVRQTSKHHMIEATRRGVPPSAANDVVNHILWREFLALSPEGWRERTKEG